MKDNMTTNRKTTVQLRTIVRLLVTLGAAVSLPLTILGLLPVESLATDLPSHFMVQYVLGASILFALAVWCRPHKAAFTALGAVILLSLWQVMPFLPTGMGHREQTASGALKILQANVLFLNRETSRFQALIEKEQPDIIVASEVNIAFADMLERIKKEYPHQQIFAEDNNPRGLAVASRLPLEGARKIHFDSQRVPAQEFWLMHGGKKLRFLSIHPLTPIADLARRDREFRLIAARIRKEGTEDLVLLGDFNATPWCNGYKNLVKALKLKDARPGRGILPTWPVFFPLPAMRIPIDHVLLRGNIEVRDFRLGPDIGSDHLPTIASIGIAGSD